MGRLLLIALIAGVSDWKIVRETPRTNRSASASDLRAEAYWAAKVFVRRKLKTPAAAAFPSIDKVRIIGSYHHWNVFGYVDSQNGYGAFLRVRYEAYFDRTEDGKYRLHYVKFDE